MKKILPVVVLMAMLLSACGLVNPQPAEPTPSDEQLATRVSTILTAMPSPTVLGMGPEMPPTATVEAPLPTETVPQPTLEATAEPTQEPTAEPTDEPTTEPTQEPTAEATVEPDSESSGGGVAPSPTAPPTLTVPSTDPRLQLGTPAFVDSMDSGDNWPTGIDPAGFTSVSFPEGRMLLTGLQRRSGWRLSTYGADLADFYIEAVVTVGPCKGDDRYGIIFRVPEKSKPDQGYWFGLTCDGRYALQKWDARTGAEGTVTNLIYWTKSDLIQTGANATNRMGIMAVGNRLILYVNGVKLAESSDKTWLRGAWGIFVGARETKDMTILVDEVSVWTNPKP